jgi:hypothetical protein
MKIVVHVELIPDWGEVHKQVLLARLRQRLHETADCCQLVADAPQEHNAVPDQEYRNQAQKPRRYSACCACRRQQGKVLVHEALGSARLEDSEKATSQDSEASH